MHALFKLGTGTVRPITGDVFGMVSIAFWPIVLFVSVKYVLFMLRPTTMAKAV
jgi:KUP system potassium uptake protein